MKVVIYHKGYYITVDADIAERIKNESLELKVKNGLVVFVKPQNSRTFVNLARFVLDEKDFTITISYKNGNYRDNSRENLVPGYNGIKSKRMIGHGDSVSQYRGVSWDKKQKRWRVQMIINDKNICLGFFKDEVEAAMNYDWWASRNFEDRAILNFPEENYWDFIPKRKPEGWVDPNEDKELELL